MAEFPVFVVGSARSGTSVLAWALQGSGYFGYNEGHVLPLLRAIERDVDRHFQIFGTANDRVLSAHVNKDDLKTGLYRVIADVISAEHQGKVWFDKTGGVEMIEAIPILRQFWPGARFIFAHRRAIENVLSRIRKFPNLSFETHCADWARHMQAWRLLRARMPDLPAIEIDQYDIAHAPEATSARIAGLLNLTNEAQQQVATILCAESPERTDATSTRRIVPLPDTGWTADQIAVFHARCGHEMRNFGYTEDDHYRIAGAAPAGSAPPKPGLAGFIGQFESLGNNGEFTAVQRRLGAAPTGLFADTFIGLQHLVRAIATGFPGVEDPTSIDVVTTLRRSGAFTLRQSRYAMVSYVEGLADDITIEAVRAQAAARLIAGVHQLRDDVRTARKLFVRKGGEEPGIRRLASLLRQHGPNWLLWVVATDDPARIGTARLLEEGLLVGYIDRFCPPDRHDMVSHNIWLQICINACAIWPGANRALNPGNSPIFSPAHEHLQGRAGSLQGRVQATT